MLDARPIIGITPDVTESDGRVKVEASLAYGRAVSRAGGVPIVLSPDVGRIEDYLDLCAGFVFTGGDDPRMEPFGTETHPKATPMHPLRQEFETALLQKLENTPRTPVLGVCLGMQMMCLVAGGTLYQHLADTLPTHARHWGAEHAVVPREQVYPLVLRGNVHSKHKQAVANPGRLVALASSEDGVLEAVHDASRRFYVGVQWHPERTTEETVGQKIFDELVLAAKESA